MENENQTNIAPEEQRVNAENQPKVNYLISASIVISSVILAGTWIYTTGASVATLGSIRTATSQASASVSGIEESVLPSAGVELPVVWGDLGQQMVRAGVIDKDKFEALYVSKGSYISEYKSLLLGKNNGKLKITRENSGYLLNLLWALGLGNKNVILEKGEMMNPGYGGAQNFASTGGWTIAQGNPMDHYSHHEFVTLTPEQQALVEKVAKGVYRPCCGNSTLFPDCNHGMAMLGLLELMASQGANEQALWSTALTVNSYWFPNNYLAVATYMKSKGIEWKDINPKEILGSEYSSIQGNTKISSQISAPQSSQSGGGCSVGSSAPVPQVKQQASGCGV